MGTQGVFAYGLGFGLLAAIVRSASGVSRRAEAEKGTEIAVKEEKTEGLLPYLESTPRAVIEKKTLEALLNMTPKDQWEDPPENSPLGVMKVWIDTYGPGKATKMSWWDYFYMRNQQYDTKALLERSNEKREAFWNLQKFYAKNGQIPLFFPGPSGPYGFAGNVSVQWRGREHFSGDQIQTWVRSSGFSRKFIGNTAYYRQGLKTWQRGIEIGMAHGYFLIGPFCCLGPARHTPEAATVGLLCGVVVASMVTVGGFLVGACIKPDEFDSDPTKPQGYGWQEVMNWHAIGALGGAGFAHALLTVFNCGPW
jgi:photosystem I subunit 11